MTMTMMIVEILVPTHVSHAMTMLRQQRQQKQQKQQNQDDVDIFATTECYYEGVAWRGIIPMLLEAPSKWTRRLLRFLLLTTTTITATTTTTTSSYTMIQQQQQNDNKNGNGNGDDDIKNDSLMKKEHGHSEDQRNNSKNNNHATTTITTTTDSNSNHLLFFKRMIALKTKTSTTASSSLSIIQPKKVTILIQPPCTTYHSFSNRIFNALVNRVEHAMLQKQTLSAWMSTLGGGYFFCRQLSKSLRLSQHQRQIALQLQNYELAQQCLVNEIFNWLYIGNFNYAYLLIHQLEQEEYTKINKNNNVINNNNNNNHISNGSTITTTSTTILRQCQAARILAKRLQKFQKKLEKYRTKEHGTIHAIDDYQRIRLVQE